MAGKRHMPMTGPKPKDACKTFKRLLGYVFDKYLFHCILVVICILISVFANVQGTLFTKTLIDAYILPMLGSENPDFTPLAHAIFRVVNTFFFC